MDYLLFLTGLFLLAAGVGCRFFYKEDPVPSRWPLLSVAMFALCFKVWGNILIFALGLSQWTNVVNTSFASLFATALVGFVLSPLVNKHWLPFALKWGAVLGVFALTFTAGVHSLTSLRFIIPVLLAAFAGGWKITESCNSLIGVRRSRSPIASAVVLTAITAICLMPEAIEISFDVEGQGRSYGRIVFLAAIALGTLCSTIYCLLIWSYIYDVSRNQLSANLLRRRKIGTSVIITAAMFTATNGAWLAHWLGNQARQEQKSFLLSALQLGAHNLDSRLVQNIKGQPEEVDGNNYKYLRSRLVDIHNALPGSRFVYLLGMRGEKLVFLVDAENPNNEDTFSPPGEPIKDYPLKWGPELAGNSTFNGPDRDQWGVWFAAVVPIFDQGRNVVGLLGVDYPAASWLQPLASRRLAAMGVILSVALLLLGLFAFHLISIETTLRVESLSERLSDAMTAAEFDTWECFPKPFKLNLSERLSSALGWVGTRANPSFRRVWRHIHPEDRYQIFALLRQKDSSEAEIRIKDINGRWLWFMLRGRIVQSDPDDPIRLVGTILNIDERQRARLEIDKQRRFAQHVMESVPNGLAVISAGGVITYVNPAFIRISRSQKESLVGRRLDTVISGSDLAKSNEGFETALACPDQSKVPVQVFRAPLLESSYNAGSILAVVDLTGSKEAEQNLQHSRAEAQRLALVAKSTDNAVVITDATGRIEWVNEGFTKISGYVKEEVIGKIPESFLHRGNPEDSTSVYMQEQLRAGKGFETEVLNIGKSGRAYIVHIECQPLVDRHGRLTGFMAIERDITQTRRSSNLLEAVATISTTLLSRRIDSAVWSEILASLGSAANVDRCYLYQFHYQPEDGVEAMLRVGFWNSSATKHPVADLQHFQHPGFDRWYQEMSAGREVCGPVTSFPQEERPPLTARDVRSIIIVPVQTGSKLWGFLGFETCNEDRIWEDWEIAILRSAAANIGLRQVAQKESEALVLARDEANNAAVVAERANRSKSTFLATMSHEIRTPLNAVIGMASLLETTPLSAQQQDYAETILNSSNFLLELINDILDYSRIESGRIELDSNPFTLSDVCREAFDLIRLGAMGKQLELIARIAPHLPEQIEGDRSRIRQVLINLLSNAVKFTPAGFVSLIVDGIQQADGKWNITFDIKDSGIGISAEAVNRLFRPFVQEDSSTTRRFGGSGLGLAISKRLTQLMGGDITVHSIPGQGSSFVASLVVKPAFQATPAIPITVQPAGRALKILIVDDNTLNRRTVEEIFASWSLACHAAGSGLQAIQQWSQTGPYDLIIADHHMPGMDGVELTRYLRTLPNAATSRFALLSSESNTPAEIRELFDDISAKPIWPTSLQVLVNRLYPEALTATIEQVKPSGELESERLGNLRVLVAEDNLNNQKVIRLLLRRFGIEPHIVANGQQAVEAANSNPYDIIFLDLQMPVMDGLQAARGIIGLNLPKRPYIIALTANAFQEDRDAAIGAGMDDYLSKPITLSRLRETLSSIVTRTASAAT